ncbi:MAG: hypothetical protein NC483_01610 [Ruminococcus sp.]|nr:hypothetical protein [Ruminococcus sp.]
MKVDIISKDISKIDLKHSFFHYTSKQNLETILKNGLEPRIGENSLYVEKTPKVFFTIGEKGIITIMDVWLKWLTAKISTGKFKYWLGTVIYMRIPFCIKSIPNNMVKKSLASKSKRVVAYAKMKEILDNSVFLILDLQENIDFSYDDIDEVKRTYYESFLKLLYPSNSDLNNCKMEYWNMHTYSNKIIEPKKISLLKNQDICNANSILISLIEKDIKNVQTNNKFLYEYYIYVKNLKSC